MRSCLDDFVKNQTDEELMRSSAEVNTLFRMGLSKEDRVVFLCSDTEDGKITAEVLAKDLEKRRGCRCVVKPIRGLQTNDGHLFNQEGIPNLTDTIINECENHRGSFQTVLIATTGFKATIPYLTLIGMVFNLPIRYIFEHSENVIELPPIPIEFDKERLKRLEPVIDKLMVDLITVAEFRQLTGYTYEEVERDAQDILLKEDNFVMLRPVGRILYQRYLQTKGYKIYIHLKVKKKLDSGQYNRLSFEGYFDKMKDPIHLQSKLHPEVKQKGRVDLECYKPGNTNERIFFYSKGKGIYICDIFMHDEYERELNRGGLLREKYNNNDFLEFTA